MTDKKTFEVGQQWKCRNGGRAVIVGRDPSLLPDYLWLVWYENSQDTSLVTIDGRFYHNKKFGRDLIEPWRDELRTGEFWVNVYADGAMLVHSTRKLADKVAGLNRIACVHVPKWTEGEGLENDH